MTLHKDWQTASGGRTGLGGARVAFTADPPQASRTSPVRLPPDDDFVWLQRALLRERAARRAVLGKELAILVLLGIALGSLFAWGVLA